MKRREFISLLGGAAAAWPLAARAQGARSRIAILSVSSEQGEEKTIAAFIDGLRTLGYVMGQNVDTDYRYAEGDTTRLKPLAEKLIALKPDVAFATSSSPTVAVKNVAPSLAIVCPSITDFLLPTFVANYSRPGGSVTGVASYVEGLAGKLLELALEVVPSSVRIGFLINPTGASMAIWAQQIEAIARARSVALLTQKARTPEDLAPAFNALVPPVPPRQPPLRADLDHRHHQPRRSRSSTPPTMRRTPVARRSPLPAFLRSGKTRSAPTSFPRRQRVLHECRGSDRARCCATARAVRRASGAGMMPGMLMEARPREGAR
jgi:hypothetical protein